MILKLFLIFIILICLGLVYKDQINYYFKILKKINYSTRCDYPVMISDFINYF